MHVLVVSEFYLPDDATANGTVTDVCTGRASGSRAATLHIYLLAPLRETTGYGPKTLLADRERVTLLGAEPPLTDLDSREPLTEDGYATDQLRASATLSTIRAPTSTWSSTSSDRPGHAVHVVG